MAEGLLEKLGNWTCAICQAFNLLISLLWNKCCCLHCRRGDKKRLSYSLCHSAGKWCRWDLQGGTHLISLYLVNQWNGPHLVNEKPFLYSGISIAVDEAQLLERKRKGILLTFGCFSLVETLPIVPPPLLISLSAYMGRWNWDAGVQCFCLKFLYKLCKARHGGSCL